jgi:Ku protein
MQRPSWEGHLKLSLVACPVALYSATDRGNDISFHLIHKKTHSRIRMVPHDPKLGAVKRTDLQRGYEVGKNRYVILSNTDIEAARIESTKNIDIESFVEMDAIDRVYWDQPYYVAPQRQECHGGLHDHQGGDGENPAHRHRPRGDAYTRTDCRRGAARPRPAAHHTAQP